MATASVKANAAVAADKSKPIYKEFNLKSDDDDRDGPSTKKKKKKKGPKKQGRMYSKTKSEQPSGIHVDDMIYGIKMAQLSCTDDEDCLKSCSANAVYTVQHIVGGSEEDARKPLSTILKDHFDLNMDCWMDESGVRNLRAVDTQGFIASNDTTIVLSYRFTTTLYDWSANLSVTTSEWDPNAAEKIGHAGYCSCMYGWFSRWLGRGKPRVQTAYYNNWLYTIPQIKKYIMEPLMEPECPPKKIYIVGASLGAAISTVAFMYLLFELPWETLDHKLYSVTVGSPRVCNHQMRDLVKKRMEELRPLDKAVICRCVYNQDLVPHFPLSGIGFTHLEKLVYITTDGDVIINPKLNRTSNFREVKELFRKFKHDVKNKYITDFEEEDKDVEEFTAFEKEVVDTPGPIRDHMAIWYLTYLEDLKENLEKEQANEKNEEKTDEEEAKVKEAGETLHQKCSPEEVKEEEKVEEKPPDHEEDAPAEEK